MSKRARITLNPESVEAEQPEPEAAPSRKAQSHAKERDREGGDDGFEPATAARGPALNPGTMIKVIALGLAAVSVFFLFRNRRP
jgi:hypothetical protein